MNMSDTQLIVHNARKIAELEVQLAQQAEDVRDLLEILKSAGIKIVRAKVSKEEAKLIDDYRRARPEGKEIIDAAFDKLKAELDKTAGVTPSPGLVAGGEEAPPAAAKSHASKKVTRASPARREANTPSSTLPAEFFKRS